MLRQDFRLNRDNFRKAVLQCRGDLAAQLLAPAVQERAVGGVLHQRMLEGVHIRLPLQAALHWR
jgi:hypothetical protein